jgi:prolycopene isomerase
MGIPVTVVESHNIPGGYATSFERAGGRFNFEVSLHGTSINNNESARILEELGVLDKIDLIELPEVYRLKTPSLDFSVPQRDPEAYIRMLSEYFPQDADGIRGFVQEMLDIGEEVEAYGRQGKFLKSLLKVVFPVRYKKMWNVRNKTLDDLMSDYIKNPELKNVLSALWGYYGLPPSKVSGFYYAIATGGYLKNGSFHIRNRSLDLSYALADAIEKAGGRILYDTRAQKIHVNDGVVNGVTISGGKFIPARSVVSNASALTTFKEMIEGDSVPADYVKKLDAYQPSISSFIVWLGLNKELRGKVKGFSTHVGSGQNPDDSYKSYMMGEIEKCPFSVSLYDNIFEGYSKPGTSSLMILALSGYEPWTRFESDYRSSRKDAYSKEKERWMNILIKRAEEQVIPALSSMIEYKEAATPLTNMRYTGNPNGAIYGFDQSLDNAFMNRIENRTPIKGLYLASAWGNPGGGYSGVIRAGQDAFQKMMEDWKKG